MKKTLRFTERILAPRARVWSLMLGPESYRVWTAPFCEGSYFEGSWAEGAKIRFLAPSGDGMTAIIAENRPQERVSIRHLGEVKAGVDDTTSPQVQSWAPAHETFDFVATEEGTELQVSVEVTPAFEQYMNDTYPRALKRLKELCEST